MAELFLAIVACDAKEIEFLGMAIHGVEPMGEQAAGCCHALNFPTNIVLNLTLSEI